MGYGSAMQDLMTAEGWGDDLDMTYPHLDEPSTGWPIAVGYRFGPDLQVEAQIHLFGGGVLLGTSFTDDSMLRFEYDVSSAAVIVSRRVRWVLVSAGPAWLRGAYTWQDERERRRIEVAEEKPLERPGPPSFGFPRPAPWARSPCRSPCSEASARRSRPNTDGSGGWIIGPFQGFPARSVDFGSTNVGLGVAFLL